MGWRFERVEDVGRVKICGDKDARGRAMWG